MGDRAAVGPTSLLADPALIRTEINNRLSQHRAADPVPIVQRKRIDAGLAKTGQAITRLINAFQEELISLDELRARMPDLRSREASLRHQLDALASQLADREGHLRLADNLEDFLTGLHDKAVTATCAVTAGRVRRGVLPRPRVGRVGV